jgi:pre-rRNA-processing protein TSR3
LRPAPAITPPVLIIVRRGESPRKCTIRPLRGSLGITFLAYPLRSRPDLARHLLLTPDAPPLTPDDAHRPLLLLDASWRHAQAMLRAVQPVEARSIPPGWQTAYPRSAKTHTDPPAGLATIEALYAALCTLGHRHDHLLDSYPWRDTFLTLNLPLLPPP